MAKIKLSLEEYEAGAEESNGMCTACGDIQYGGCEPDARKYLCENCGARSVFGFEECLMMGLVE